MASGSWQQSVVRAPVGVALRTIPDAVGQGAEMLEILHERSCNARAIAGTRRFRATWSSGSREGTGYVEVAPLSSHQTEVVVHLDPPKGLIASLTWDRDRLDRQALSLVQTLRDEMEQKLRRHRPAARRARGAAGAVQTA